MAEFPHHAERSLLVVMSGPSGAGKSTLLRRFLHLNPDFLMSISVTTRSPRPGEVDGRDYSFVPTEEFQRRLVAREFLEHAQVFGQHWYGTPRGFIEARFAEGRSVIKDIDVQGAAQIRSNYPDAVLVYVVPPSREEIERRLRSRASETHESIARRLDACEEELSRWRSYDYLIVNDDLDHAAADLTALVRAHRLRIARVIPR
jgi:guanylate kinase